MKPSFSNIFQYKLPEGVAQQELQHRLNTMPAELFIVTAQQSHAEVLKKHEEILKPVTYIVLIAPETILLFKLCWDYYFGIDWLNNLVYITLTNPKMC